MLVVIRSVALRTVTRPTKTATTTHAPVVAVARTVEAQPHSQPVSPAQACVLRCGCTGCKHSRYARTAWWETISWGGPRLRLCTGASTGRLAAALGETGSAEGVENIVARMEQLELENSALRTQAKRRPSVELVGAGWQPGLAHGSRARRILGQSNMLRFSERRKGSSSTVERHRSHSFGPS